MLLTFSFTIVKDQLIFGNAVKDHLKTVFAKSDELEKETIALVTASGTKGINPEEIFNAKCSACHRFDVKLVGPPYQQTVPKYNGDVNKLSEFIYNPVKVNADYPPMPNQGLKKKEADAMAQWLITKIGKK
jgi:cytochrome c551/c552